MTNDIKRVTIWNMKKINSLQLRQSLSKVILVLQKTGEPILLEKGRKPAAVIISLDDFKKRFLEKDADEKRSMVIQKIRMMARESSVKESSENLIRELRDHESI